jgi:hypothetical protein
MERMRPEHQLLSLTMLPGPTPEAEGRIRSLASSSLDWDYVISAASRLGTLPLLSNGLSRSEARVPPGVEAYGREARQLAAARTLLAERALVEIRRAFTRDGVPLMVLKGLPLAHELYGEPGLRPVGDIDLLVARRHRDAGLGILRRLGYTPPAGSLPLRFFRLHHFHAALVHSRRRTLPVELHWDTQPPFSLSRIPETEVWRGARTLRLGDEPIQVSGREETFLMLVQHLCRHALGLGGRAVEDPVSFLLDPSIQGRLIWLSDLALLARIEPALDWDSIASNAERWGLQADLRAAASLLERLQVLPEAAGAVLGRLGSAAGGGPTYLKAPRAAPFLPGLARGSKLLQFRPILVLDLWRYTFPGMKWIRLRYGLESAPAPLVGVRALAHAGASVLQAGRFLAGAAVGIVWVWLARAWHRGVPGPPRTRTATDNTPSGNCQEAMQSDTVHAQEPTLGRFENDSLARGGERVEGAR